MRSAKTINNIKIGRNNNIKKGMENLEYIGRFAPYGYKIENKKLVIDKQTAPIVYLIFDLYYKGFSNTQIADYLNDRFITNPSTYKKEDTHIYNHKYNENRLWNRGIIRKIISNKVYNGYYKYSAIKTHKEIISEELFKNANSRYNEKKNYPCHDYFYLNGNEFCGKVYCKNCGKVFTIEKSRCKDGYIRYLRCSSYDKRNNNIKKCNNDKAIRYDELKDITSLFIEKEVFNQIDIKLLKDEYNLNLKSEDINNKRYYIKMEKEVINKKIDELSNIKFNYENKLINEMKIKDNNELILLYKNRLKELDSLLKELNSFSRTKEITNKDLYLDRYIIESFIDKIYIEELQNNNRNIEIIMK